MARLENYKREVAFIVFSQRRKILLVTLLFTLLGAYVGLFFEPIYGAYGSVLVKGRKVEKNLEALEQTDLRALPVQKQDLYSEVSILTSDEVLARALRQLADQGRQAWVDSLGDNPKKRLKRLKKGLLAEVIPTSNIIEVQYRAEAPEAAQGVLAALLDQYIRYRTEVYNPQQASAFLSARLDRFRDELGATGKALLEQVERSGVTLADKQIEYNLQLKHELMTRINDMETEVIRLRLLVKKLDEHLARNEVQFFSYIENPGILALGTRLQELMAQYQETVRIFHDGHAEARQMAEHVQRAYGVLKREVQTYADDRRNQLTILERSLAELKERVAGIDAENVAIKRNQVALQDLERDRQLLRSSYETFFVRNEEAQSSSDPAMAHLNAYVAIVTPATAVDEPLFPKPELLIPAALLTGLLLGLSLGFLHEYYDHTFKRPEDVEQVVGLPLLFSLALVESPAAARTQRHPRLPVGGLPGPRPLAGLLAALLLAGWPGDLPPRAARGNGPAPVGHAAQQQDVVSDTAAAPEVDAAQTPPAEEPLAAEPPAPEPAPPRPIDDPPLRRLLTGAIPYRDPGGDYYLQLRSDRTPQPAELALGHLADYGVDARMAAVTVDGVVYFRLLVGPYPTREEAREARKRLLSGPPAT